MHPANRLEAISTDLTEPYPQAIPVRAERPPPKKEYVVPLNLIVTTLALLLGTFALAFQFYREQPQKGLSKYDLSTPRGALESELKMMLNQDIKAGLELVTLVSGPRGREKLNTLEVRRETEWRGKVLLFVTFTASGVRQHKVEAFEKDARSGYWISSSD